MPELADQLQDFLKSFSADNIKPTKAPRYAEAPPVWSNWENGKQFLIGVRQDKDIRYFTQVKLWVKPPTQNFPESAIMLSLVNGKGSVFCKLNGVQELRALMEALSLWIPQIEDKIESLKALEKQYSLARAAFDATLAGMDGDKNELGDTGEVL